MTYLLDTNVLSEPLVARPDPGVMAGLREHADASALAVLTWHEMHYAMERLEPGRRKTQIQDYLEHRVRTSLPILPYDTEAAHWHARERARLEAAGRTPPFVDGQIAAIAAVNGLTLVTRNHTDFADFADLRVESWFS